MQHWNALEVSRRLRLAVDPENSGFIEPPGPAPDIWRTMEKQPGPETRHNVVVVVLESMSGEFLSALGGRENLTPNLDGLARQGLFFTNLYATGTRTVRGLEAIALSAPPTPPVSILKRPNNDGLFTIGTPFMQRGYDATFFYGGHSYFDNMGHFSAATDLGSSTDLIYPLMRSRFPAPGASATKISTGA